MSKWTIGSMILGFGALVMSFIGDSLGQKGLKEEMIEELKKDYLVLPKIGSDED